MDVWLAVILPQLAEELFHLSCGLVNINNLARMAVETENADRLPAHAGPHVRNLARYENGLTGPHAKSFVTNLKFILAIEDLDPLILVVVEVARPPPPAGELKNTHRAVCVPCG